MWLRLSYLVFMLSATSGCANKPLLDSVREKSLLESSKWNDVTLSESLVSPAHATVAVALGRSSPLEYKDLTQASRSTRMSVTTKTLTDLDYYRRLSFYLGAIGGIYSFVADSQDNVRGRTIGNAVWGIGWTCWLGFGAVIRADIRQLMDEHNEAIDGITNANSGTDDVSSSWAILWQLSSF